MKKYLVVFPILACILSSCMVQDTLNAMAANQNAINMSTDAINENVQAVECANRAIEENIRQLEAINKALKKVGGA